MHLPTCTLSLPRPSRRTLLAASATFMLSAVTPKALALADDAASGASPLVVADQGTRRVLLLGDDGSGTARVQWSWSPQSDKHLADLSPARTWRNVSEAKMRALGGRKMLLASASEGLAAVLTYPGAVVQWATVVPSVNVHSLELLPDGNVALAASNPGVVRVYAATRGPRSKQFTAFNLAGAHGVSWDDQRQLLWAVGDSQLVALKVTGPAHSPGLSLARSVTLPDPSGHDLDLVASAPGRMWVTTGDHVLQYDPDCAQFIDYDGQAAIDISDVKSVGDDPATGRVLTFRPQPGNACAWCGSTVALHLPSGSLQLPGSRIYKARWSLA